MSNLRRAGPPTDGSTWKKSLPPASDACYWSINHEKWKWKTAEIIVKFTKIESGINLAVWGSENDIEGVGDLIGLIKHIKDDEENELEVGKEYAVNALHYHMVVIAHPEYNSETTGFEFEFYVKGTLFPWYE